MDANETLLLKDEVYRIVGCAMEALNGLGMACMRSLTRMRWQWSLVVSGEGGTHWRVGFFVLE